MPLPRALSIFSLSNASKATANDSATETTPSTLSPSSSFSAQPSNLLNSAGESTSSTQRNRKKRAQKKAARARRRTTGYAAYGAGSDEEDDRDADEDAPPAPPSLVKTAADDFPEADEDDSYLYERNHPPASGAEDSSVVDGEGASTPTFDVPSTPEGVREAVAEAARRRRALDKDKKIKASPSTRLQLPPGAGMVEGVPALRSTPERRRKLEEAGFVPLTDEDGMLRMGVRVSDDTVIVPRPGAEEPIVLRM